MGKLRINDDLFEEIFGDKTSEEKKRIKDQLFSIIEETENAVSYKSEFSTSSNDELFSSVNKLTIVNLD